MKPAAQSMPGGQQGGLGRVFSILFGAFLGLSLLKFGNPPILEKYVVAPDDVLSALLGYPWPISWGYWILGGIALIGLACVRPARGLPGWLVALPLAWFLWEVLAGSQTVALRLTGPTLKHLAACVTCFYLGLFCLNRSQDWLGFWLGLCGGYLLVLAVGWEQQFGGLAQSRQYFYLYVYPQFKEMPPEYLKRMSSNRIFATQFYPNALAGVVLLIGPSSMVALWRLKGWFTSGARAFLVLAVLVGGLGCVFWSGSKGGWLLMMILGLVTLLRLPLARGFKVGLLTAVVVAGLAGFFWKYSSFFEKGATSVGARFDYWRAATQTVLSNPICGTGPGTFSVPYEQIKRPESEMTRLVHNDYLEQASDSGLPGLALYGSFIGAAFARTFRRLKPLPWPVSLPPALRFLQRRERQGGQSQGDAGSSPVGIRTEVAVTAPVADAEGFADLSLQEFAAWLGVLGWALQGLMEFGLYLPALAWPAFTLLGWLLGRAQSLPD